MSLSLIRPQPLLSKLSLFLPTWVAVAAAVADAAGRCAAKVTRVSVAAENAVSVLLQLLLRVPRY